MRLLLPLSLFLFVLLCLLESPANAQGLCDRGGGGFEVNVTEGCAPLTVTITNTVQNPIAVGYAPFYDGKSFTPPLQDVQSVRYTSPGTFTLLQQVAIATGRVFECKKITVYETAAVTAQYTSCGGGKITASLVDNAILQRYDQVLIEWGDGQTEVWQKGSPLSVEHVYANTTGNFVAKFTGEYAQGKACSKGATSSLPISFQQAQLNEIEVKAIEMRGDGTLRVNYQGIVAIPTEIKYSPNGSNFIVASKRSSGGIQPVDIKSLNKDQSYQVKLTSQDLCQGERDSKVIASMTLKGQSNEGKNLLEWNRYPISDGFTGYDLVRDGVVIKSFTAITDLTYTDEDVQCGSYADYQIVAKIGDITSTSAPVGVRTELSNPRPIQKGAVSVIGDNIISIKADVPGSGPNSTYDLTIERADAGTATFRKIITLYNQNEYSDLSVKANEMSYCYRMSYQNSCGQKLPPSQPICTILLKKDLISLNWTADLPILGGISGYEVLQRGSNSGEQVTPTQMETSYTIRLNAQSDLEYNFQVRANSASGDFESLSNIINYRRSAGVFVPDAFSPNGDGYNDVLEAKSTQLQSFAFSVLNRWGQVVFHSDDIAKGWDGTINGANAPVGSYVYKMTFVDDINQTVEKSGTFMLLR